jgi:hypothetical protein
MMELLMRRETPLPDPPGSDNASGLLKGVLVRAKEDATPEELQDFFDRLSKKAVKEMPSPFKDVIVCD